MNKVDSFIVRLYCFKLRMKFAKSMAGGVYSYDVDTVGEFKNKVSGDKNIPVQLLEIFTEEGKLVDSCVMEEGVVYSIFLHERVMRKWVYHLLSRDFDEEGDIEVGVDLSNLIVCNDSDCIITNVKYIEKCPDEADWASLSSNPVMISTLEKNLDRVSWYDLSSNSAATHLLGENLDKVNWYRLAQNVGAGYLINTYLPNVIADLDEKSIWCCLSDNAEAIHLLEQNLGKVDWKYLSRNPAAIHLLEQNPEKIDWVMLCANPAAIHLIEKNLEKVNWKSLSENIAALHIIEQNLNKVDWKNLSRNPAAIDLLEQNPGRVNLFELMRNPAIYYFSGECEL